MSLDPETAHVTLRKIQVALTAVASISEDELRVALNDVEKFDALAPFIDPTLYLDRREDNRVFGEVVRGLLEFRRTLAPYAHRYYEAPT